jgi:aldose 1-epimerase
VNPLQLDLGHVSAVIDAAHGGRLASLIVDGRQLISGDASDPDPLHWGSYAMVPWVGRIRRGRFSFEGVDHQLPINFGDHSIHGTGFAQPWAVTRAGSEAVELEMAIGADGWPFTGFARQRYELEETSLTCWIEVHADVRMPAAVGWHPWFPKPDSLDFAPATMYLRDDDYICTAETVAPPPPPWDDSFTDVPQPVRLQWGDFTLSITSSCDHWVVYDMPDHATCVEPQSGPSNTLNLAPAIVEPGEPFVHWMRLAWG